MDRKSKNEKAKTSRRAFLGAGIIAGGALYADPSAALAGINGRPLWGRFGPETLQFPKKTEIGKLVQGSFSDGAGALTLADLSQISETNEIVLRKLEKEFPSLQINDLLSLTEAIAQEYGGSSSIIISGGGGFRCCCSCTCCQTT